jgi:pimeloyl-ACP methyl ester carboxylesterase
MSWIDASGGVRVHFTDAGNGPAVVLIHGWSCDKGFWRDQAGWASRYRLVSVDLAGHGQSRVPATARPWSMAAFAADVVAVIDALGIGDAVLVGHSMGGAVAVEAALLLGERCRLLLGVDTLNEATFYRGRPGSEIRARLAPFERDFAGAIGAMAGRIVAPHTGPALVTRIAHDMSATDPACALAALAALLAWDIDARWPLLRGPCATINSALAAQRDETIPLTGLEVVLQDGVGHFPMLEDPPAFDALAHALIARHLR